MDKNHKQRGSELVFCALTATSIYQSLVTTDIDLPSMTDVVRIGLRLLNKNKNDMTEETESDIRGHVRRHKLSWRSEGQLIIM